jgi:hypothetical protein
MPRITETFAIAMLIAFLEHTALETISASGILLHLSLLEEDSDWLQVRADSCRCLLFQTLMLFGLEILLDVLKEKAVEIRTLLNADNQAVEAVEE